MNWYRQYAEFAHDPKVQSMSEAMQRRLVMLFCLRCSNDLVTLHETDICFSLRISESELQETKSLFIKKGFIDEQWNILHWDKRQSRSDSSSERVKRYRERIRNGDETLHETQVKRYSNGLDKNRIDKKERKNIQKEIFIPPDWIPQPEWLAWLKIRKPKTNTPEALALAVKKLELLRAEGNSPKAVLEQSILSGYQGIFPLKDGQKNQDIPWNMRPENRMPSPAGG